MFKYSLDNKRYHTLNYHYNYLFGTKISKISLNGGFTCPNRDGTISTLGCIYCSKDKSGEYAGDINDDIRTQFKNIKKIMDEKWNVNKYIAYFQAGTNTYANINKLKYMYEEALSIDGVVGLSVATRPDAIDKEALKYLKELNTRTYLTVELGLQTIHDSTSKLINRGHNLKVFEDMVKLLRKNNINVVVHIINGLPYETKDMMISTIKYLNKLDIQGVKIHMLYILKDTPLYDLYKKEKFKVLSLDEYVDIVCDQIEYLRENIVIHRITGDPKEEDLIEPTWVKKKFNVLNNIDIELNKRGTYQGFNKSILNRFDLILNKSLKEKDIVIDATVGNGIDTLKLLNIVKKGFVFGFDIQKEAIEATDKLLQNYGNNYRLFLKSHEYMYETLSEYKNKISLVIFNLGYLPNGNKEITTNKKSTIKAIDDALKLLNKKGTILLVCYPHEKGKEEAYEIEKKYKCNIYRNTDNINAPYLIEIRVDNYSINS